MPPETNPTRPPAGQVLDPGLYALARARWPGHAVTVAMLTDIAALTGRPPHIAATPEKVATLAIEMRREQRRRDSAAALKRDHRRLGFDPTHDYRKDV